MLTFEKIQCMYLSWCLHVDLYVSNNDIVILKLNLTLGGEKLYINGFATLTG